SMSFMSVTLTGRSPYERVLTYEKLRDEHGREMHRSWGNAIDAAEALDNMGADVMRWMFCEQVPSQNLKFGYGPAADIRRRLLTLWNSAAFLDTYATIEGFRPRYDDLVEGPLTGTLRPLDRWLLARTQQLVGDIAAAYEAYWTPAITRLFEEFTDDLSNWYIRRSRRRFYAHDEAAFRTLWYALTQAVRVIAPVMPFLAEHLWQNLVAASDRGAPESVFLAGWPEPLEALGDEALIEEIAAARRVAELARSARQQAGLKLRQPLRRLVVATPDAGRRALVSRQVDDLAGELRVKEVAIAGDPQEVADRRALARLDVVGPRLGPNLAELRRLLAEGKFEVVEGSLRADGFVLAPGEYSLDYTAKEGWAVEHDDGYVVAVDTRLDPELELEGRVLDVIHAVQRARRDAGLEITDRIVLTIAERDREVLAHEEWIKGETLATRVELGGELAVRKDR
ncbi:MAG TPA: class I tRNA ligase family protein, partial [Actinomycetota bacterium]|nr:class I tRNA ligase family protein [Actinomycetota bacterium]